MKKKLISILLAAMILMSFVPLMASAVVIISSVSLTVNAPAADAEPSFSVGITGEYADYYGLWSGETPVEWYDVTSGKYLAAGNKFTAGHTYRVIVWLECEMDTGFAVSGGKSAVSATVNGLGATVNTAYEKDPSEIIEVTCDFELPAATVSSVTITGVTVPEVGKKPNYSATVSGAGYEAYNTEDNEIDWYDLDSGKEMMYSDVFEAGHSYRASIWVKAKDGYAFAVNSSDNPAVSATVNRSSAVVNKAYEQDPREVIEVIIDWTLEAEVSEITDVSVTVTEPKAGEKPSFTATVPAGAKYSVQQVLWFDDQTSEKLTSSDKFVKGKAYILNITLVPASGCSFSHISKLNVKLNGGGAQIMTGDGKLTIQRTYILDDEVKENPFVDVKESDLFYDAVLWAFYADPQITNGVNANHFGPDRTVTRGQTVTFLWRAMGCPEPKTTNNPFEDVSSGKYYYKAVLWAVEQGITNGTDATHFSPDKTCSTAHIITFIYRTVGAGSNGWYQVAGAWAKDEGLLDGIDLEVSPKIDCPRADVVLFLFRKLSK